MIGSPLSARVPLMSPEALTVPMRTSAAPTTHEGTCSRVSALMVLDRAAAYARFFREWSRVSRSWWRTVKYAAAARRATERPTAIVASKVTRLARDRRYCQLRGVGITTP